MKRYISRIATVVSVLAISLAAVLLINPNQPRERRIYAQFVGAANVPGFATQATNQFTNTAIGSALAVTNPSSNFVMNIQGGPVYCGGSEMIVGQSTMTLQASTTYQIEWNCGSESLYAKTAVTAPGTSTTNPGVPQTILAPIPNVEIPIATVVCNATACGNGGNGSITDARPVALFPGSGTPLNTTLQANLPAAVNGTIIYCSDCTTATACTSGGTGALASRQNGAWKCL